MKHTNKFIVLALSIVVMVAMLLVGQADTANVSGALADTELKVGETTTFTVNMKETTVSSIGTTVTVSDNLEIVSAKWLKTGVIASYDTNKNKGAYTPGGASAISGNIFEVTVKVKNASGDSKVSVEVIAKNGSSVIFSETASKTIKIACTTHDFGNYVHKNDKHVRVCNVCGYEESQSHTWNAGEITTEATCKAKGVKTYTCTICPATKTESIPQLTHKYSDWAQANDKHTQACILCGDVKSESHKWDAGKVTTEPTCAREGVKTYSCSVCSALKTEPIAKTTNHTFTNWYNSTDSKHERKCTLCNLTESKNHEWDSGKVTTPATCDKVGVKTYTCKSCNATRTEDVAKIAHTFDNACDKMCNKCPYTRDTTHNYSSKWNSNDHTHWHECTVCKVVQGEPDMHTDSEWIIDKNATEFKAGSKHIECTVCKRVLATESIPATGCKHEGTIIKANAKDATCTEAGQTADELCSKCNTVLVHGEVIPATGHKVEVTDKKDATCTEEGFTGTERCSVCEAVIAEGEKTPALGHTEVIVDAKDATCTEEGFTGNTQCSVCHSIIKEGTTIAKTEHNYKDGACTHCYAKDPNKVEKPEDPNESQTPEEPKEPATLTWLWILIIVAILGTGITVGFVIYKKRSE